MGSVIAGAFEVRQRLEQAVTHAFVTVIGSGAHRGETLIVRISRARVRPNAEAEAFGILRDAVATGGTTEGLEAFAIARRVVDGQLELVAMTTWRDLPSLVATMGEEWARPAWLPGLASLVESSTTEHFETVAQSFRGLAALELTDVDLLEPTVGGLAESDISAENDHGQSEAN